MEVPFMYDYINTVESQRNPNAVTVENTPIFNYFRRYLLQKAMSVFEWKLPDNWSENYFLYTLYCNGVAAIINTDKYGVIPQGCTLGGYNVFYQPSYVIVANPIIYAPMPLTIDKDCVLFRMTEDYGGIMDLINYYASQMSLAASGYSINLLNSRLAYAFSATDKSTAESFKKAADQALSGKPYVVIDKNLMRDDGSVATQFFEQNLSQNFIAPQILDTLQTLANMFATDIGLPNANKNKKEREIVDEVNANNVETASRADMWLANWKESCKKVKTKYGIDVSVDWRVKPDELGGVSNDVFDNERNGSVQLRPDTV